MAELLKESFVKKAIIENKGKALSSNQTVDVSLNKGAPQSVNAKSVQKSMVNDLKGAMSQLRSLRAGSADAPPVDISLAEYAQERWGFAPMGESQTPDSFYNALGLKSTYTIDKLMTLGEIDEGYRWLIPELFREAVRLGMRKDPIYPSFTRESIPVSQVKVTMPDIKMSEMGLRTVGEGETISTGSMSFGTKDVKINKLGRGFKITDEAVRYTQLNMVSIAFEDAGVKLRMGLDALGIDTLINGDQTDGSDSCAIIGTANGTSFAYRDLLKAWIRLQRLGMRPDVMLSNEDPAIDILELAEFKGFAGETRTANLSLKTPVPQSQDFYIHGAMPNANYLLMVNKANALIKLDAVALTVESDRIVNRQLEEFYVTLTTGFATMKRDARLIMNRGVAFSGNGFPTWMDVSAHENINFNR